jgi:fructokinase
MTNTATPVVLAIGEACIDVVRRNGTESAHPGGSPMNVAVGASRLGVSAALSTRFADDDMGALIVEHTSGSDVTLTSGSRMASKTSSATATIGSDGSASYLFDFAWDWTDDIDFVPRAVHTGSIGAIMAPGGIRVLDAIRRLRESCLVTFDPNSRPALMGERSEAAQLVEKYVALADVVKASDEDLEWLYPDRTPVETATAWSRSGPALVVVTAGGYGATVVTSDNDVTEFIAPAVTVSDTIGAGDSFMAGLIASLFHRGMLDVSKRGALHALTTAEIASIVAESLQCAAITVQREGADPPRLDEVSFGG